MNRPVGVAIRGLLVLWALAAGPAGAGVQQRPEALLHPLFGDHAVLQRDRPIAVWGVAAPGDRVTVALDGRRAAADADSAGRWRATLPPMRSGGPYTLEARARSGAREVASDVLIGDVWLCSGQSNMEMAVFMTLDGRAEIARAANDSIRLLTVAHAGSSVPLAEFGSAPEWQVAGPATVRGFSAVCWYFARELQRTVLVPMGLINASWGGAAIEPWIGEAGLRSVGGFDERLDLLRLYVGDPAGATRRLGAMWERWWRSRAPAGSAPWLDTGPGGAEWREALDSMRDWKTWGVAELAHHDGMVWFRRTFTLEPAQAAQGARLSLGGIDEVDQTWVDGVAIGNTFGWGTERTYRIPPGTLRAGENVVVVNVLNTFGAGGMYGPAERLSLTLEDGTAIALAGGWKYQVVPSILGFPPRAPWESVGGLTTLANAMLAPLGSFGLRGVVWYQGESNTGAADEYQALLAGLMADWRARFGATLPFLVVQLPNFGATPTAPTASGWASLREAQRRAVAGDPHAGLAVTIDIGDPGNLHPPNKPEVGRRLARAARRVVYGEAIAPSGPTPRDARRARGAVVVRFRDVEGALVAADGAPPTGFELCGADQASCRFVSGSVRGDRVVLEVPGATAPTRVRYCWGDAPRCDLRDRSGLPAGPFEIQIRE